MLCSGGATGKEAGSCVITRTMQLGPNMTLTKLHDLKITAFLALETTEQFNYAKFQLQV